MKEELAAAVRPENEIGRRVRRYERGLRFVVRMRDAEGRTAAITNDEYALARQYAEAITAYERQLRETPLPEKKAAKEAPEEGPALAATTARRRAPVNGRRRRRPRRKAPQEAAATPQEG